MPITATRFTTFRPLTGDQDGDGRADAGDVLRHTLTLTNTGTAATSVTVNDLLGGSTETGLVNVSPIAFDDMFTGVIGNTMHEVDFTSDEAGIHTSFAGTVLTNDVEFFSDTFSISKVQSTNVAGSTVTVTSANGGTVVMTTQGADAGSFTYVSAAGFTGNDTFTYTITDDGIDGIAGNADDLSTTATVTMVVAETVWYVSAGGTGNGTSTNPFGTLTSVQAVDSADDFVYVSGSVTGTLALEANSHLIGTGANLTVGAITLATATANSTATGASGFTVTLGTNSELAGINIGGVGGITGTGFGTVTVNDVNINTSGQALSLTTGAFAGTGFDDVTSAGGASNVSLTTVTGTVALGAGTMSGATGSAFNVSGGSVSTTYSGSVSQASAGQALVNVANAHTGTLTFNTGTLSATNGTGLQFNNADGTYNFNGTNTLNGGDAGVDIINGSGGAFSFSSSSSINNPTGVAFNVDGGAGNIDYNGTIAKTSNGQVISVVNHTGGTVSFDGTVSSTTSSDGINLTGNTGATIAFTNTLTLDTDASSGVISFNATGGGTVTATGAGSTISAAGAAAINVSGGTAIGAADLNFVSVSANGGANGIVLNGTGTGGLNIIGTGSANSGGTIQNMTDDGIVLTNVSGVNFTNIRVMNVLGHGIDATNLGGVNTITTSTIQDWDTGNTATKNGLNLVNLNTNMTSLVITGGTFNGSNGSNDGVFMEAQGTSGMSMRVDGVIFTDIFGDGVEVQSITGSSGTVNLRVWDSFFQNAAVLGNGGVQMDLFGNSNFFADIDGNTFTDIMRPVTNLGAIGITNGLTADSDITIRNNVLSDIEGARGITATVDGGTTELLIDNNTINGLGSSSKYAISVNSNNNTSAGTVGNVDVTIVNNDIGQTGNLWTDAGGGDVEAIFVTNSFGASIDALITSNVVDANTTLEVIRARASGTGLMNVTMTNNDVADTLGSHIAELQVTAGTVNTDPGGTINASISGNILPGGGVGRIGFDEGINGTPDINVQQASAAAVAAANSGATVTADPGVDFNQAAPALPTTPTLPSSPLMALEPPEAPDSGGNAKGDGTGGEFVPPPADDPTTKPDAGAGQSVVVDDGVVSQAELALLVEAAIQRWADAGATAGQIAAMRSTTVSVANLPGQMLGSSSVGEIVIDNNAAGFNWFVDATPGDDSEYSGDGTLLGAIPSTVAAMRIDLLTTIMHELGHQIGLEDNYASADNDELMFGSISIGERRLPGADDAAEGDGTHVTGTAFILTQITLGTIPAGRTVTIQWDSTVNAYTNQVIPTFSNTSSVGGSSPATSNAETMGPGAGNNIVMDSLTLGGTLWNDDGAGGGIAGNGIKDGTEAGHSGVTMTLFADTGTTAGVWDASDAQLAPGVMTNAGGNYLFVNLAPGDYIVRVDAANFTGSLSGRSTTAGSPDPDDNIDNDDNGSESGGAVYSQTITLAHGTEPDGVPGGPGDTDGDNDPDTNFTLDFGFVYLNKAPVNTVPVGAQLLDEGGSITFSVAGGNPITVADADAGVGNLIVTLSIADGVLTPMAGSGATIGGTPTNLTITGTLTQINAALNGLVYTPPANANGPRTLTVLTNDQGNTGFDPGLTGNATSEEDSDPITITITAINDTPVVTAAASGSSTEQVAGPVDATATISDIDLDALNGGNGNYAGATLAIANNAGNDANDLFAIGTSGAFTVNGSNLEVGSLVFATFSGGNGIPLSISFTSSGTPATTALVNAVVQSIQYTYTGDNPPVAGIDVAISLHDGAPANAGQGSIAGNPATGTDIIHLSITNTSENVSPVVDLNTGTLGNDDSNIYAENGGASGLGTAIGVTDADADMIQSATITITDPETGDLLSATLPLPGGITIHGSSTATTLVLTGSATAATYAAALGQVGYSSSSEDPTDGGTNTNRLITVTVNDGTSNSAPATMTMTVFPENDAPTLGFAGGTVPEFSAVGTLAATASATDPDNGSGFVFGLDDNAGGRFAIDPGTGAVTVADGDLLDFEGDPTHDITIRVTDPGGAFSTSVRTITLTDAPEFYAGGPGADMITAPTDENWVILGEGGDDELAGLSGNDRIEGGDGRDGIAGGGGSDFIAGGAEGDWLFGENGGDTILGNGGDDRMEGGAGQDGMAGGAGDDYIDGGLEGDWLFGEDDVDTMLGDAGDDRIEGGAGSDGVLGGTGADYIDGGADGDWLFGEDGDDTILGGGGADRIEAGAGADGVLGGAGADYIAGGADNDVLFGNDADDTILGEQGDDLLDGGAGSDGLSGGTGADIFAFTAALGASNIDFITDFVSGTDKIALDDVVFQLSLGELDPASFVIGPAAEGDGERIVYDNVTGALYFDSDGGGGNAQVQFAQVQPGIVLTASDFFVI
ncbi:MAG TPA: cadherin domain-containing protein [Allosphingosinicella sp.]|nr:cadherin domain-containing protein [Allosphingosinicella sp.]